MARKKGVSNQSVGREGCFDHDVKRLRHMSAQELQDYYDRVEPLSDDEVKELYDRIMPNITYEIASEDQQEKPHSIGGSIKKTALVAICMTLLLTVVAQALGVPVWETFITWTKENFHLHGFYTDTNEADTTTRDFSTEEIAVWGEDLHNVFLEIGITPHLPQYTPYNLTLYDLFYYCDDNGIVFIDALYTDDSGHNLSLFINLYTNDNYAYDMLVEYDDKPVQELQLDGITYHLVSNLENNTVSWNDMLGTYTISGNIEVDALDTMIHSIDRHS